MVLEVEPLDCHTVSKTTTFIGNSYNFFVLYLYILCKDLNIAAVCIRVQDAVRNYLLKRLL